MISFDKIRLWVMIEAWGEEVSLGVMAMTKQEEKDTLARFVCGLPLSSYLRPIMEEVKQEIQDAITNDLVFVDFGARIVEQREHRADIAKLANERNALKEECRKLEREAARLREGIDKLRDEARRLAS